MDSFLIIDPFLGVKAGVSGGAGGGACQRVKGWLGGVRGQREEAFMAT